MALTARFVTPIQVVTTPAMKAQCKAIADAEGVSLASVYRDAIHAGLEGDWMSDRIARAQ